ncbi:hypothetical protein OIU91_03465 [Streptomyces sp. NBC_01456]|uniref:hypothetical protein n=1 Tax=unclassified Streptomyces TaxID=2593676 RepID=UPI002E32518D|nr:MULTISPECIES: hypothetical protein [unclassified Streptomyces]
MTTQFDVATGSGLPIDPGERRLHAAREAFEALCEIRRLMNTDAADPLATPALWERCQAVRAVALTLEANGLAPSALDSQGVRVATGYCVEDVPDRGGVVRVRWVGPSGSGVRFDQQRALQQCEQVLTGCGWTALLYRGPRRQWYLEVEALSL